MSIKPATDEAIEFCVGMGTLRAFERSLIARIRIERENAIKECAEIALAQISEPGLSDNPAYIRYEPSHNMARKISGLIRSLLKAPSNQEGGK